MQELFNKLKVFAEHEDQFSLVMTFVAFLGTGHRDGQSCYFQTKPRLGKNIPFEIWANCEKLFTSEESSYLNGKPKLVFIQLTEGTCIIINKSPRFLVSNFMIT